MLAEKRKQLKPWMKSSATLKEMNALYNNKVNKCITITEATEVEEIALWNVVVAVEVEATIATIAEINTRQTDN